MTADPKTNPTERPQPAEKLLIVNADDLGLSAGVNRGIFEAHERGIVSSASLMVRWPALREAADYAKAHPSLGVGLHLDFAEWCILDDQWTPLYEVVDLKDSKAVRAEVERQLEAFWKAMNRPPTHLDSHQHVHKDSGVWPVVHALARELNLPLRHDGQIHYCGDFYGQDEHGLPYPEGIGIDALQRVIRHLPAGVAELACHPGYDDDGGLATMYRKERELEVRALCDPRIRATLAECRVRLVTFADVIHLNAPRP